MSILFLKYYHNNYPYVFYFTYYHNDSNFSLLLLCNFLANISYHGVVVDIPYQLLNLLIRSKRERLLSI